VASSSSTFVLVGSRLNVLVTSAGKRRIVVLTSKALTLTHREEKKMIRCAKCKGKHSTAKDVYDCHFDRKCNWILIEEYDDAGEEILVACQRRGAHAHTPAPIREGVRR